MTIIGLDISKYQGKRTAESVAKMISAGVKFAYVRFSQGIGYKDGEAENNTRLLQAGGIAVGPYHFTTKDDATQQLNNFLEAVKDFQFELPPAMDCEAYTAVGGMAYAERDLRYLPKAAQFVAYARGGVLGYSYPTAAIVWSILDKLSKGWMLGQTKLAGKFPDGAIYTNASSGNRIFGSNNGFSRFPLWVANWNVPTPYLPKAWEGKPYFIWQDYVERNGDQFGIDGAVDHDQWGDLYPFPGEVPPPPPPPPSGETPIYIRIGQDEYEGTVSEVEND